MVEIPLILPHGTWLFQTEALRVFTRRLSFFSAESFAVPPRTFPYDTTCEACGCPLTRRESVKSFDSG